MAWYYTVISDVAFLTSASVSSSSPWQCFISGLFRRWRWSLVVAFGVVWFGTAHEGGKREGCVAAAAVAVTETVVVAMMGTRSNDLLSPSNHRKRERDVLVRRIEL